jgi:hypothetical protein
MRGSKERAAPSAPCGEKHWSLLALPAATGACARRPRSIRRPAPPSPKTDRWVGEPVWLLLHDVTHKKLLVCWTVGCFRKSEVRRGKGVQSQCRRGVQAANKETLFFRTHFWSERANSQPPPKNEPVCDCSCTARRGLLLHSQRCHYTAVCLCQFPLCSTSSSVLHNLPSSHHFSSFLFILCGMSSKLDQDSDDEEQVFKQYKVSDFLSLPAIASVTVAHFPFSAG